MKTTRELRAVATAATFSLIALAAPSAMAAFSAPSADADMISTQSNKPMEGHDVKVTFSAKKDPRFNIRYRARTIGGEGVYQREGYYIRPFAATEGTVEWVAGQRNAVAPFIVSTNLDFSCDRDQEVRIVLDQPVAIPPAKTKSSLGGWRSFCPNPHGWPCRFEATAYFSDNPRDCQTKTRN